MSDVTERAEKYYSELPPHAKNREGPLVIKLLLEEINQLREKIQFLEDVITTDVKFER